MKPIKKPIELRALREKNGMNQTDFWGRIGLTQSAGSRYENGQPMSEPVALLIHLIYVCGIDPHTGKPALKGARK